MCIVPFLFSSFILLVSKGFNLSPCFFLNIYLYFIIFLKKLNFKLQNQLLSFSFSTCIIIAHSILFLKSLQPYSYTPVISPDA